MMQAKPATKRKPYVVKKGYVYSDPYGTSYRPGELVQLSEKEYDLAKHRVTPFVAPPEPEVEAPVTGNQYFPTPGEDMDALKMLNAGDVDPLDDEMKKLLGPGQYETK